VLDPVAAIELKVPVSFELVGPEEVPVELVKDPNLRAAVLRSLRAGALYRYGHTIEMVLSCDDAPVDLCFKVFVRDRWGEWEVGRVMFRRETGFTRSPGQATLSRKIENFPMEWLHDVERGRVDVILRPDPDAAAGTADIVRCWGEEVVMESVPLNDPWPEGAELQRGAQGIR
jgi:hypothetical protein